MACFSEYNNIGISANCKKEMNDNEGLKTLKKKGDSAIFIKKLINGAVPFLPRET